MSSLVTDSPGDPAQPFDADQLMDKASRMLAHGGDELDLVQTVLGLPTTPSAMRTLRTVFGYAA